MTRLAGIKRAPSNILYSMLSIYALCVLLALWYMYVLENMYVGFNCASGIIWAGGKYHTNVSSADVANDSK